MSEDIHINEKTDQELVDDAGSVVVGTASGLKAQAAQAELMRRNTSALHEAKLASDRSADRMLGLTLILGLVALLQLLFSILSSNTTGFEKLIYSFGVLALVAFAFYDYFIRKDDTGSQT